MQFQTPDTRARAHGFVDEVERHHLIGLLDTSRPGILFAYDMWTQHDGTKARLLKLIEASQKKL